MREAYIEKYSASITDEEEFLRAPDPEASLPVEIIDHDRLKCGTDTVRISPAVLALNGLLRCRKEQAAASAIRDAGKYDYSDSSFMSDARLLSALLTTLTTIDPPIIIEGKARGKKYQLSPELDFIDRRDDARQDPELRRFYYGLVDDPPLLEEYQGERIEFISTQDRRSLVSDLLKEASSEPSVRWLGMELPKSRPELLEKEQRILNFALLERAIAAYIQPGERTSEQRHAITDGAMAFQELFMSTLAQIRYFADKLSAPAFGRDSNELFQVGAEAVLEQIMTFNEDEADENDKGFFFYNKMAAWAAGSMRQFIEADRWHKLGVSERSVRTMRKVFHAQEELVGELGREPSPAEIAQYTGIDTEEADKILYLATVRDHHHVDAYQDEVTDFSLSKFLLKNNHVIYSIDHALELLHIQQEALKVFLSTSLSLQEKIVLSVYYGIYVPHLAGERFLRKTRSNDSAFTYPDNEDDFLEATRSCLNSPLHTGKIIRLDRNNTSDLIKKALENARKALRRT